MPNKKKKNLALDKVQRGKARVLGCHRDERGRAEEGRVGGWMERKREMESLGCGGGE